MIRKVCTILSTVLIVLMLLIAGVLLVPYLFGYRPTAVLTGSMEPTYHVGSVIFVKEVEPEEIQVKDVITYSTPGMGYPTTHRVMSIDTDKQVFVTQGDANNVTDGEIAFSRLLGRPAKISLPLVGYISNSIQTTLSGKLIAAAVVLAIILLVFLPDLFTKKTDKAAAVPKAEESCSGEGADADENRQG